jgi:hypothetical protein
MARTDTLERKANDILGGNEESSANLATLPSFGAANQIGATTLSTPTLREALPAPLSDFTSFIRSLTPDTSALDRRGENLRGDISDTIAAIGTKGDRQLEVEGELGLPEDRQRLRELNLQVAQLRGEFDKAIVNEEGSVRPIEFITGRQDFLQKKSAVMVGALTSVAQALQGNITLAEQTADRTIEREFADEEAELARLQFEYTENKEALEKADKQGADQLALYINERSRVLADQKEERQNALAIAQLAAINGAPNTVVSRIAGARSQEEALSVAGGWLHKSSSNSPATFTQSQYAAQGFADRVAEANTIISQIGDQFTGTFSSVGRWLPNRLKSAERQQFEQAQRNFINAVLRRESGAAIAASEFDSAALQYFPQPGDTEEVLLQKQRNREIVLNSLQREGGITKPLEIGLDPNDPLNLGI